MTLVLSVTWKTSAAMAELLTYFALTWNSLNGLSVKESNCVDRLD